VVNGLRRPLLKADQWSVLVDMPVDEKSLRKEGHELPDDIIRHISPQIWEHINLTGIYDWNGAGRLDGTFRPLRNTTRKKMVEAA